MDTKRKNPLYIFLIIIFLLIIFAAIGNNWKSHPLDIQALTTFKPLLVVSDSMTPALKTGDIIIIRKNKDGYNIGDIITYWQGTMLITHRVVDQGQNNYITKGDANSRKDNYQVSSNDILGKLVFKIPYGGYLSLKLSQPLCILAITAIYCIVLSIYIRAKIRNPKET